MAHLRRDVLVQSVATVRYETPPGRQLQIDFSSVRVPGADEPLKVHLFVATLGYSTSVAMFPARPPFGLAAAVGRRLQADKPRGGRATPSSISA